jgi:hypothetical protein
MPWYISDMNISRKQSLVELHADYQQLLVGPQIITNEFDQRRFGLSVNPKSLRLFRSKKTGLRI